MSVTDLQDARRAAGIEDEDALRNGGHLASAADIAEDAPEEELFPQGAMKGDHKVTIKNIVPAGKARKTEAKMGATAIPLLDGLVRYGEVRELLVTVEAGKVEEVPDLQENEAGGTRTLLGVKDVQRFRPIHVRSADDLYTREQVLEFCHELGASDGQVAELLGEGEAA